MSTLAQEEADRFFSQKEHHTSHPEDRLDTDQQSSHSSPENNSPSNPTVVLDNDDDNDEDTLHNMAAVTSTPNYHVPYTRFDANTGPKGVIADAQSFNRAKQSTFRKALANFTNNVSSTKQRKTSDHSSSDDIGSDEDEEFMKQWRQNRLQELSVAHPTNSRRSSPSRRTWGTLEEVDANGYLDAIEKVTEDAVVVVCIYDPESSTSAEVEDVLGTLAYKHSTTRFVKLHHDIAEMNHITIPAILAYRRGDVFATLSDCKPEGLSATLIRHGILQ